MHLTYARIILSILVMTQGTGYKVQYTRYKVHGYNDLSYDPRLGVQSGLELREKIVNDQGIELGLTVCVTSIRYRQTNSAQALKETNRFIWPIPRIHAHTQGCHTG